MKSDKCGLNTPQSVIAAVCLPKLSFLFSLAVTKSVSEIPLAQDINSYYKNIRNDTPANYEPSLVFTRLCNRVQAEVF